VSWDLIVLGAALSYLSAGFALVAGIQGRRGWVAALTLATVVGIGAIAAGVSGW